MADDENRMAMSGPAKSYLFLKFIIPTLLGIFLFLTPLTVGGKQTIVIGVLTDFMRAPLEPFVLEIVVFVVVLGAIGSGYFVLRKPDWRYARPVLHAICHSTPVWFFIRSIGAVAGLMVYFQVGPELVWGADTGRTVFMNIGVPVFFIFVAACFLLPLLTDYGFMEFVGAMLRRPFAFLFRLPGRSAIDATASFVSASSVGLLITINQYNRGYYTAREAAAVATNFSVVSVPFSLVVADVAGLSHMFFTWYLVVLAACLLCALITVRIPPLIWLPNQYNPTAGKQIHEDFSDSESAFKTGVDQALGRAARAPSPRQFVKNGWLSSLDVVFGVIGPAMAITTLATIIAVHTPVFDVISWPIYYVLEVVGLPEAQAAAPGFVVGFLDMFMPALVA